VLSTSTAPGSCFVKVSMSNPLNVVSISSTEIIEVFPAPVISDVDTVPSVSYAGGIVTVFGNHFIPRHQTCVSRFGASLSFCVIVSATSALITLPTSLSSDSYIVSVQFSNPTTLVASTSRAVLQLYPAPSFSTLQPFIPSVAYTGTVVTVSGQYFLPYSSSCSVAVCAVMSASCNITALSTIIFVMGPVDNAENCTVVLSMNNPPSLNISSSPGALRISRHPIITSAAPVVYAGSTLTIRGVNFDPLHQTCSCSLG